MTVENLSRKTKKKKTKSAPLMDFEGVMRAAANINSLADAADVFKDVTKQAVYQQTPLEKKLSEATSNQNWNAGGGGNNNIMYIKVGTG